MPLYLLRYIHYKIYFAPGYHGWETDNDHDPQGQGRLGGIKRRQSHAIPYYPDEVQAQFFPRFLEV